MSNVIENLGKLDRKVTLAIPKAEVEKEKQERLVRLSKTVKMAGFRPGKVPMKMVEKQYGQQVEFEVRFDKAARKFFDITQQQDVKVAGQPKFEIKTEGVADDEVAFDATFEVYPEVKIGDLSAAEVVRTKTEITDAEIDKTIDILRKQRVHYHARGEAGEHGDGGGEVAAKNGDRVTVDFVGKIDGVEFAGGKAEDFVFVLGEGRMLPEFEQAALGLKVGESKTFPLAFPEDYHGKEVAGKTAEFTITVKEVAEGVLPELNGEFAKSLGQPEGDLEKLKADIRSNIEREVKVRSQGRTKSSVMDALVEAGKFDVPKALVDNDVQGRVAAAREELKQRGIPNAESVPIPAEAFTTESERRVRLGLLVSELVKQAQLQAKPEQVRARIEEFAQNYEQPAQVVSYYLADRQRRAEIEAIVLEDNVVAHVLEKAKVTEEKVPFDQLMGMA